MYSRGAFSCLCFSVGVWRCLLQDMNFEDAPPFIFASEWVVLNNRRTGEEEYVGRECAKTNV